MSPPPSPPLLQSAARAGRAKTQTGLCAFFLTLLPAAGVVIIKAAAGLSSLQKGTQLQDVYTKTKPKVETAVEHSKMTYENLRDAPPGFYPRLGLIGFAGIVGLFLARGSRIKKIIYPLGFVGIGASLYYPQQAATIAKDTGTALYDWSLQGVVTLESLWKDGGKKKSAKKEEKSAPSVKSNLSSAEETTRSSPESSK